MRVKIKVGADDRFEWKGGYTVAPIHQAKLYRVWERFGIEAREDELIEDEMQFKLRGTKAALIKFLTSVGFSETDVTDYLVKI